MVTWAWMLPLHHCPETPEATGSEGTGSCGKPCVSHSWEQASDALQSRVPNCGTQFCFHRNQFGGIFIFNYSATSNFPFTPQPDRRREIAYVNHPRKRLTNLKSPPHRGSLRGALGMCPSFFETNGDTRWPFAPVSGTLFGTCSPCHEERQIVSKPAGVTGLGTKAGSSPDSSLSTVSLSLSTQPVGSWSLEITCNTGSDSGAPNPVPMT